MTNLDDPAMRLWLIANLPGACRSAVAWTVWLRVSGFWPCLPANRRVPNIFPRPNRLGHEAEVFIVELLASSVIVFSAAAPIVRTVAWMDPALTILTAIAFAISLTWLFWRLHQDDVRSAQASREELVSRLETGRDC